MTHWMHTQALKNREKAHRMNDRGTPLDFIARYLQADPDTVKRWIGMPRPILMPRPSSDDSWMVEGICNSTDPELWFPEKGKSAKQAIGICRECPVRQKCLEWAISHNETVGVWGGITPDERKRMRTNAMDREREARKRGAA